MGRCKLTLPLGDGLLITPTLRLARKTELPVLVVLPPEPAPGLREEVERYELAWVTAHEAANGQAESLKAGIREVVRRWPDASGVLVLLGDLPRLPEQAVRAVLDAFTGECAVVAAYRGQRGHPVILPRAAFADVLALSGDTGARGVLNSFGPRLVEVDDPGVIFDVDEAETYTRLSGQMPAPEDCDFSRKGIRCCGKMTRYAPEKASGAGANMVFPERTFSRPLAWLAPVPHLTVVDAYATETPRNLAPTESACLEMLVRHDILPNVLEHSRKVAGMAVALARRAVENRGILSPENPGGVPDDLVDMSHAGGLLHDVAKTWCIRNGGGHAQVGAAWVVAETGNFRVAQAVLHHVEWPWELPADVCVPALFVNYADRRTMHNGYVTLAERHEDLLVRYGRTEASRQSIIGSTARAKKLEHALSAQLEISLDACTVAGGRLVPRT